MPVTPARRQTQFTEVVQGPRASAADFGAAEAGALGDLGGAVHRLGEQAFQQARENDTFIAQQAYNKSVEVAQNLSAAETTLQGENAIGGGSRVAKGLDTEVEKLTKGMSSRQKKMFDKNWTFRRNGYLSAVAKHEKDQTQKAMIGAKTTILEAARSEYAMSGGDSAYTAGKSALEELMDLQGLKANDRKIRIAQYDDDMRAGRFDTLVKAEEFDEARGMIDDFRGEGKTLAKQALDGAENTFKRNKEAMAAQRANLGSAKVTLYTMQNSGADPFYVAPRETYRELYEDPEVGDYEWRAQTQKMASYRAKYDDAEMKAEANTPEARSKNIGAALDVFDRIRTGGAGAADVGAAIDTLKLDESSFGTGVSRLLSDAMDEMILGKQDQVVMARLGFLAEEAKRFNDRNRANNPGWGKAIKGKVEMKDGKIVSDDPATEMFMQYASGLEQYLQAQASESNSALTALDVRRHADDYFRPLRSWVTAEDIVRQMSAPRVKAETAGELYGQITQGIQLMLNELSKQTNEVPTATGEQ